jgi:BMFP domain-containing protein YqiC
VARGEPNPALTKCEAADARQWQGRQGEAEVEMSFMNANGLDDLAKRLADSVPESLRAFGRDLESNFKAVLQAQLAKLDLVTRQDFDVQAAILERTQAKLTAMEARLKDLETKLP